MSRTEVGHDLAYYRVLIKVGPGDYDIIAVHRLVREPRRGMPIRTVGSLFFIHGSGWAFQPSMVAPHGSSGLGVFLGNHNIDVWGIDLRSVQIPADATQLPDAHDWGYDLQIKDVGTATRTARYVRLLTGQGFGRIILGGQSAGAALVYAVANAEAGLPKTNRDVRGLIPMDMVYKLPPSAVDQVQFSCNVAGAYKHYNDSGLYFFNNFATINIGKLAQTDPNGISPYGPPLTNLQYALESAAALSFAPFYPFHSFAVVRDESGVAADGRFTQIGEILQKFATTPPYLIPNAMLADMFSTSCPTIDTPYDDNLGKIRLPVLNIANAGGFGPLEEYTLQLLGSKDVQVIMNQLLPDDPTNDFGHLDSFTADRAPELVWEPVRKWIVQHQNH